MICRNTIGLGVSEYLGALWKPALFSVIMAASVHTAGRVVASVIPSPLVRLVGLIGLGAALYAALYLVFDRTYLNRLRGYLTSRANAMVSAGVSS
jgi:hypothetical protein